MHLHAAIEFLMLNKESPKGLSHKRQNFWKQKALGDCIRRLRAKDLLGEDRVEAASRNHCDDETIDILSKRFLSGYGETIIRMLDRLAPYRAVADAANRLEKDLKAKPNGAIYHAVLFEGQGQGQVFDSYVDKLKGIREEHRELSSEVPPRLEASYAVFERRKAELDDLRAAFATHRNAAYTGMPEGKLAEYREGLHDLFSNTFTTEAFQVAVLVTFWAATESVLDMLRNGGAADGELPSDSEVLSWFDQYLGALNAFLDAREPAALRNVLATFFGEVKKEEGGALHVVRFAHTLKRIVVPGELKPEEWTKFRYVLLEIWGSAEGDTLPVPFLSEYVQQNRVALRASVLHSFLERELRDEAERMGVLSSNLDKEAADRVGHECRKAFATALRRIGVQVTIGDLEKLMKTETQRPPAPVIADDDEEAADE
jgi:hypothetical protein